MSTHTPTWSDAIDRRITVRLKDVHTSMPARVESYDATSRRCTLQPLIKVGQRNELGVRVARLLPVVPDVPVVFPGGGGAGVVFPIEVGDVVLMTCSEASLDRWLAGDGRAVDPADARRFVLTDAMALPWQYRTGGPEIEFTVDEIHAGGTEALALQSDLQALRDHVNTLFSGGTGSAIVPAPSVGTGTAILKGG